MSLYRIVPKSYDVEPSERQWYCIDQLESLESNNLGEILSDLIFSETDQDGGEIRCYGFYDLECEHVIRDICAQLNVTPERAYLDFAARKNKGVTGNGTK